MKRYLAVLIAILLIPLTAQADEVPPCPEGFVHLLPFCFTPDELTVYLANQTQGNAPSPVSVDPEALVRQLAYYYWPDWAADRMIRIAKCESGFDPNAQHPRSGAAGLWQIMPFWQEQWPGDYFDPWTNAAVAYQIWLEADRHGDPFRPWVCKGW